MPASPSRSPRPVPPGAGLLLFGLLWAAVVVLLLRAGPDVLDGALLDTDAYMRLVRVRLLADTGAWFDGSIPRSNWPWGETLHWTRPLDVLILAGSWLLRPFADPERALHLSGVAVAPLLLLALALATGWAARPLTGRGLPWVAMTAVLFQPTLIGYSRPGRPDHHPLILLAFVIALGFWIRALASGADDDGRTEASRSALAAGLAAAFGLWVSTEFLVALAVLLAGGVIAWIGAGRPLDRLNLRFAGGLATGTAAALLLERGPGLLAVAYERISVVHVFVTVLAAGFWAAVALGGREGATGTLLRRSATAGIGALVCFGVLALVFPAFFEGPMTSFDHPVVRFWLSRVSELQPRLLPTDARGAAALVFELGAAVLVLPWIVSRWLVHPDPAARRARLVVVLAWTAFLPLALAQVRWVTYVQLLVAMGLAELVGAAWEWLGAVRGDLARGVARAAVTAGLLVGPFALGLWAVDRAGPDASGGPGAPGIGPGGPVAPGADGRPTGAAGEPEPEASGTAFDPPRSSAGDPWCDFTALARWLGSDPELGERPRTVAALMDAGPPLLYLTAHRVIATPYANEAGMVASWSLMNAVDAEVAQAIAHERDVDLLLLCPARERGFFAATDPAGDTTVYGRLLAGRPPSWLRPRALPEAFDGAMLFEVVR